MLSSIDLALEAGLLGAALADLRPSSADGSPTAARDSEALVGVIDVRLLGGEVGMGGQTLLRRLRGTDHPTCPDADQNPPVPPRALVRASRMAQKAKCPPPSSTTS